MGSGLLWASSRVDGDLSSTDGGVFAISPVLRLFWGVYAGVYDAIWDSRLTREVGEVLLGELRRLRRHSVTGCIVDLGCGTGLNGWVHAGGDEKVVGVDASPAMLRRACGLRRIDVGVQSDVTATGLPAASADVVLVSNVLQVHVTPAAVLVEAARLLVSGGLVVCVWPREDLTLSGLLQADLRSGRGILRSLGAALLRLCVGIYGALVGARVQSGADVERAVLSWVNGGRRRLLASGVAHDVSRYAVVQVWK